MSTPNSANVYTQGFGSKSLTGAIVAQVSPGTTFSSTWRIGQEWVNTSTNQIYILTSIASSGGVTVPTWTLLESGSSSFTSLTGDTGTAVPSAGNVKIAGTTNQIATAASGSTVTLSLTGPFAPTTFTAHGVLLGEGSGSVVATTAGATNSVLQGTTGADPAFTTTPTVATLTTTGLLTAGTGVTATTGNIAASSGNVSASGTVTGGTGVIATTGNVTSSAGDLVASTADKGVVLGGGAKVVCGTGDPNGAVTAPQGSLYLNLTGSSTSTRAYINSNSGTTWIAVTTAS